MSPCPFTRHIAMYAGPGDSLRDHLGRCPDCRVAASVLATGSSGPGQRTPECPEEVLLAAYDIGGLNTEEHNAVADHVAECAFCQGLLGALSQGQASEEVGAAALRQGDAYVLAKELALWLSTQQYPAEKEVVQGSFEGAFHTAFGGREAPGVKDTAATGLRFAQAEGLSLASRIVAVCLVLAAIRAEGEVPGESMATRLRRASQGLFGSETGDDLVEAAAGWVVSKDGA